MNCATIIGRLTKDVELRYIPGTGTAVATCTVAVDRDFVKKDGTRDTDFIPVEAMGKTAEYMARNWEKGRLVSVTGAIRVDNYQTQTGEKRTFTKIGARNVNSLEKPKKSETWEKPEFVPTFEPDGLDPQGFEAIDDNDLPF